MRYTDGFTGKAILALKEAICAAEELGHTYIGSEHLLLGLLEEGSNAAAAMLAAQHITAQRVRNALVELVGRGIPAQVQEDCLTPALSEICSRQRRFRKKMVAALPERNISCVRFCERPAVQQLRF